VTRTIFGAVNISCGVPWPDLLTKYFSNDQVKETEFEHVARTGKEEFNVGLGAGEFRGN
jgi:hypothetical protein